MSNTQLSFALRTTSNVKTVHLMGSWDGYQGQLPLSRDGRSGSWKGTFKFQPNVLQPGQRYWFYYMMDGYKVSHDPTKEAVVEPTTGRTLNVLDLPKSKSSSRHHSSSTKRSSARRNSRELPRGRAVPEGAIACPKPQRPGATRHIVDQAYNQSNMDQLAWQLANASLQQEAEDDDEDDEDDDDDEEDEEEDADEQSPYMYNEHQAYLAASDDDSDAPSMTSGSSRSSGSSSPSSVSSVCSCERYGVTRGGSRVRLDCGGSICGSSEDSDDGLGHCGGGGLVPPIRADDDSDDDGYRVRVDAARRTTHLRDSRRVSKHHGSSRRHGMVMG